MGFLDAEKVILISCPRCNQNNLFDKPCWLCDNQRIRYLIVGDFIPLSDDLKRVKENE